MNSANCPLCLSPPPPPFWTNLQGAPYYSCGVCRLLYLDPARRLSLEAERARYDLHENNIQDAGYRAYLARLTAILLPQLAPASSGLDYGSGPAPSLSVLLTEAGHRVYDYDLFFRPEPPPTGKKFDFITCSETAEHFRSPPEDFARIAAWLRPGGLFALMTQAPPMEAALFARWHYQRDPGHIVFYPPATIAWIASRFGWELRSANPATGAYLLEASL